MPMLSPVSFLCHQIWNSEIAIQNIDSKVPILFLAGLQDEMIPPEQMRSLATLALKVRQVSNGDIDDSNLENYGIRWREFSEGTHNDTCLQPQYFEEILSFWKDFILQKESSSNSSQNVPLL